MILMKENESKFLDFIFQEADGDDVPKNRKVVNVRRKGGRKVDYTQGADLEVPDEEPTDSGTEDTTPPTDDGGDAETPDEPVPDDSSGDDSSDTDTPTDDSTDADNSDTGSDDNIEEPSMDDTDYSDDSESNNSGSDEGGDDDGPSMDDTDYSDDSSGDDSSDTDTSTDDSTDADNSDGGSQASADEQARKYSLYRKFMKLNNLLESNTEVLSNAMFDDSEINQKVKSITTKLKETNRLLSEYMVVKFQTASYIQSMLFYQRVIAIINVNFNILQDLKNQIDKK